MTFNSTISKKGSDSLLGGQFLRHMMTVASGSVVGQLIVVIATPLLSRIYTPAQFGEYATFLAMCNVFMAVACLRYDAAINACEDGHVAGVFAAACLAALFSAVLVLIFASSSWGGDRLSRIVGTRLNPFFFAAAALFCGIYQTTLMIAIRRGAFGWASALRAGQSASFAMMAILLPIGLIGSCLLGFLVAVPLCVKFNSGLRLANIKAILTTAWRFREFPLMSLPTSFLDAVSLAIPVWFISTQYTSMDAGNYSQAQRLLAAPLILFALAVGQVFIKRAGDMVRAGQSPQGIQRRIVLGLVGVTCGLLLFIATLGSLSFSVILGDRWRTDTLFLLLVFAPVAARSCVSPITGIFIIRNRLQICAIWQVFYFLVTLGLFWTFAGKVPFEYLLAGYAVSEFVCYGIYLLLADRTAR